jgi:hypothetical protein
VERPPTEQAIQQWRELRACMENLRAQPQSPIVCRPVTAVRAIVRHVVIRQHAARSAIEDSAARFSARAPQQEPRNGNANRGSWLLGEFFKLLKARFKHEQRTRDLRALGSIGCSAALAHARDVEPCG